jgi:hypothetical protein
VTEVWLIAGAPVGSIVAVEQLFGRNDGNRDKLEDVRQ